VTGLPAAERLSTTLNDVAAEIRAASWFAALGLDLTQPEADEVSRYLKALGQKPGYVATVDDWISAKRLADAPNWDRRWWDAEAKLQQNLQAKTAAAFGEPALMAALTQVMESAASIVHGAAALAATRMRAADPAWIRAAAGAAALACHQAALARLGNFGPEHAFAIKLRLFSAGRWPLGVVGDTYYLF
jgi:hypothetical protein